MLVFPHSQWATTNHKGHKTLAGAVALRRGRRFLKATSAGFRTPEQVTTTYRGHETPAGAVALREADTVPNFGRKRG